MRGLKARWELGPRIVTGRLGKNKGPVVEQRVTKLLLPKTGR